MTEKPNQAQGKWLALAASGMGSFVSTLDGNVVKISLPTLTQVFGTSPTVVVWVSLINYLTLAGLMMTFAMLADIIGRRKIFIAGFAILTAGLALGGLAQDIGQLIAYRGLQAIGGAMISSVGVAILTAAFPPAERGKALGILSITVGAGITAGPVLGGFLMDTLGWRSIFYTRIPLGIAGLVLSWAALKSSPEKSRRGLDIPGALLLLGFVCFLVIGINQGPRLGWSHPLILGSFLAATTLFVSLLRVEKRSIHPAIDLHLFDNRGFSAGLVTLFLRNLSQMLVLVLMPFYLIQALAFSSSLSGLIIMLVPLGLLVMGPLSGWLSDRMSPLFLTTVGVAIMTFGFVLLTLLDIDSTAAQIIPGLVLVGVGLGVFEAPNIGVLMGMVSRERMNAASALMSTARQLSHATGVAIAGAIFVARQLFHHTALASQGLEPAMLQRLSTSNAFHDAMVVTTLLGFLGILTSLIHSKKQIQPEIPR